MVIHSEPFSLPDRYNFLIAHRSHCLRQCPKRLRQPLRFSWVRQGPRVEAYV